MPYVALGLLLLLGLLGLGHLFVRASPRAIARALKVAGIVAGAFLLLLLIVSGRAAALVGLAPLALFGVLAWKQARRRQAAAGRPRPGASSGVTTRYFRMSLDHDTGMVSGEVLAGRFASRSFGEMSFEDLLELRRDCADDAQSVSVLEAYLDRLHPDWREHGQRPGDPAGSAMTVEEARAVLGVGPEASDEEIREAHRGLMQKLHPDRGGSTYLAAQINRARDLLLSR